MLRVLMCATAFLVVVAVAAGDEPKKANKITGKVKKVDAENGTITIVTGKKDDQKEETIKVGDDVKFTVIVSDTEKKEGLAAKEGLKVEQLKEGVVVVITKDGDKVTAIQVGQVKKKK